MLEINISQRWPDRKLPGGKGEARTAIWAMGTLDAELAEIDENLIRQSHTAAEQALALPS
ncbi:MAG: hypothetical protein NW223_19375 [Hyphomicrobiaceae bacterium]|nr:hypothetical protein [Hyphomicrobiaceae bacterium]